MNMAKKFGFDPFILLSGGLDDGGDSTVVGGGSGQSGVQPIEGLPCTYDYWVTNYFTEDMDVLRNGPDVDDFMDWWLKNGFSAEEWAELNPGLPPLPVSPTPDEP